jgi:hypothetical protein
LPPSSGSKSKSKKKEHEAGSKQSSTAFWFLVCLIFGPKDGGNMFLQVVNRLPMDCMVLYPEDRTLNNHCYEKRRFYTGIIMHNIIPFVFTAVKTEDVMLFSLIWQHHCHNIQYCYLCNVQT